MSGLRQLTLSLYLLQFTEVLRRNNTYMAGYATQSAGDGAPNLGFSIFSRLLGTESHAT